MHEQSTDRGHLALRCACLVAALSVAGCATTVNDDSPRSAAPAPAPAPQDGAESAPDSGATINGGTIVDPNAPAPTVATTGSAADLLPDLSTEMSRLGSQIAEGGDSQETFARIEAIWARIRSEIESDRPELLNGLEATIDMARIGVERRRPADADKAFALLTDLVDRYFDA